MLATKDVDYRVIHGSIEKMSRRVNEVYLGKQTSKKPPQFVDILMDLIDIEAKLFLELHREVFQDLNEIEYEDLAYRIESEDFEAIQFVCSRMDISFVEQFAKDLYLHMINNHMMFFEEDFYEKGSYTCHNASIVSIW